MSGDSLKSKADMLRFQVYVRQRLEELNKRMPARPGVQEQAELAFLEEQVVQDHMPGTRRALRDPLRDVGEKDIQHTNLSLLSRFVSDAGAILPRKLTGVKRKKQRLLTKALKRAHILALRPRTWKHPQYRHVSYADQYSKAKRDPPTWTDDEFRDPPDIRFPNRWEVKVRPTVGLTDLSRATPNADTR